jgi:hypothetical protein
MVTHELTVFPDGRIDGAFSVREGDYNSHTLRFVLTQDLTAASAKLLLWAADAEKPTVYGTLLGHGSAAGQDVQFTPVSWGNAPSRTQIQLELLDNNGNIVWQSKRMSVPVEPGIPADVVPEQPDTADATAEDGDVALGKTYYARGEKRTGTYVSDGIRPRAWADIPIDYIRGKTPSGNDFYFQRIGSTEFLLVYPSTDDLSSINLTIAVDTDTEVYREGIKVGDATAAAALVLEALDMSQPISLSLLWTGEKITISVEAKTENSEFACVEIGEVVPVGTFSTVVSRKGEVFYYNRVIRAGALSISTITKRGAAATLCQNGRAIVRPITGDYENFIVFEMLSPDGRYRKKYCITKLPESAESIDLEAYAYAVKAFVNEDSAFYDYAGAGFTPVTPQPSKGDIILAVDAFARSGAGVKDENGRVQFGAGSSAAVSFIASVENTLAEVISTYYSKNGYGADFDAKGNLLALKYDEDIELGKNTLTAGSRWLTFVNDKLIDMPGFLAYVWPVTGMRVTFFYTCADGLDVGYPYAGI